tara:strand:+ start:2222 stop:3301 length:1080 start_codon:yes stop_codon:yes gene_type:complete
MEDIKINILILMSQLETFQGLENLYNYFKNNDLYNIKIICYEMCKDTRKRWIHNISASTKLLEKNIEFINYTGGDLKYLNPDYVFYQTPYCSQFPKYLRIEFVKHYSKTCYFGYGYSIWNVNAFTVIEFFDQVDFYFVDNNFAYDDYFKFLKKRGRDLDFFKKRTFTTGNPKVSNINFENELKYINFGWTPRWTPKQSTFEKYFEFLVKIFNKNENINLGCRFHPLDKNTSRGTFVDNIKKIKNIYIHDELSYDKYFEHLDVLISDLSSMIAEFFPTGKPIILFNKTGMTVGSFGDALLKGIYIVNNEKELGDIITKLQNNIDPLKETRIKLIEKFYSCYTPIESIDKLLNTNYLKTIK